jgi:hypothetical protein
MSHGSFGRRPVLGAEAYFLRHILRGWSDAYPRVHCGCRGGLVGGGGGAGDPLHDEVEVGGGMPCRYREHGLLFANVDNCAAVGFQRGEGAHGGTETLASTSTAGQLAKPAKRERGGDGIILECYQRFDAGRTHWPI